MPEACRPSRDAAPATQPELVIITGMSGAGRSEAMHTFEDLGFFAIDNLPPAFITQLVDLAQLRESKLQRMAVVSDVRGHEFFDQLAGVLAGLDEADVSLRILFLEAEDDVLLRRFKETRRRHPMCDEGESLGEGILAEREALEGIRARADIVIDTTELTPRELRQTIRDRFSQSLSEGLSITVSSFGFKHSVPLDADIVMDVRFLPNPHYDPKLRPLSGLEGPVSEYVLGRPETVEFLERWFGLLDVVIPGYVMEGKHHLSIALGCTGGMHRSVTLAESTASHLRHAGYRVTVMHRDLGRDREAR